MYNHYHWNPIIRYSQSLLHYRLLCHAYLGDGQSCHIVKVIVWKFEPESTTLKMWLIIHVEFHFLSKKLDQNKINLPLCKYIKINNSFHIALQRHFKNKLTKNTFIRGPIKRQCTTIKQTFIKNYDDIDDNYNLVPSPEIEVNMWTPKKKLKIKKLTVFYFYQLQ